MMGLRAPGGEADFGRHFASKKRREFVTPRYSLTDSHALE